MPLGESYSTPTAAALSGFPDGVAGPLFESTDGLYAVVLLETGSSSHPYPYEVLCHCPGSSWQELSSSNGPGRHELPDGRSVLSFWGLIDGRKLPIFVEFDGKINTASTKGDYFFLALWDPPNPENPDSPTMPRLVADR